MDILLLFTGFIFAVFVALLYEYKIRQMQKESRNKVHFYVARDKDGGLSLYLSKPNRRSGCIFSDFFAEGIKRLACDSELRWYGLNEHDYDSLKWEDEPAEVFLNMEK